MMHKDILVIMTRKIISHYSSTCQIDHILVNGKWRRSLQDVKTRRLADAGSDHNLLIGKLALKLRKADRREEERAF